MPVKGGFSSQDGPSTSQSEQYDTEYVLEEDENDMTDEDRRIVQYLMLNRMVKKCELAVKHQEIFGENTSVDMKDTINKISKHMREINADVQPSVCELTGETYFVLVHLVPYNCIKKSPLLNENEITYFNILVKAVVCSGEGYITSNEALNRCPQNMTKTEAQKTVDKFSSEKMFYNINGNLSFTPLLVSEINSYLSDNFPNEILNCDLCKKMVFIGFLCFNCNSKFHNHCFNKWSNNGDPNICPVCTTSGNQMETD